jgi:hypothetical protein
MRKPRLVLLLLVSTLAFSTSSMLYYTIRRSGSSGRALAAISNLDASSVLASEGPSTGTAMQTKPIIDVRDIGADCTGATDSSNALNTFFTRISGKTLMFPPGIPCRLKVQSQLVIQGQSGFEITGFGSTPYNLGPGIFGCSGKSGAVLYINRSSLWKMSGFDIQAKGNACTSSFTQSLQVDNRGSGGHSPTNTVIDRMSFSSNWGGTAIANYIGINDTAAPNGESFIVRDSLINCQNSTGSYGVRLAGGNQDVGELHHNTINACFQGIRLEGGNPRIENNLLNNGAYSVFGANGAEIWQNWCASAPLNILYNEASDGGPFLNSNNDKSGSCLYINIIGNVMGISDIAPNAYPINLGTSGGRNQGVWTLIGNSINLTGRTSVSVIGSSSQSNCAHGPLGSLIDIGNTWQLPHNAPQWSGCVGGNDFQFGHLQEFTLSDDTLLTRGSLINIPGENAGGPIRGNSGTFTVVTSPRYCIGTSCITSWPSSNLPTGEFGLARAGKVCRITSAVTLSTASPTTICSWSLPAVAKIWFWQCSGTYTLTSGTNPTFGLGMNASQRPTSETGNGIIWSAASVQTFGSSTATASGNQRIMTGVTNTTVNAPWQSSGTIQPSATAGTFAITGALGGTGTPAGTVNVGSGCTLQ